jgi:hypothetical protein
MPKHTQMWRKSIFRNITNDKLSVNCRIVIASEAKQSSINIAYLDCFGQALAMTTKEI